jgi:hypothetical protein
MECCSGNNNHDVRKVGYVRICPNALHQGIDRQDTLLITAIAFCLPFTLVVPSACLRNYFRREIEPLYASTASALTHSIT